MPGQAKSGGRTIPGRLLLFLRNDRAQALTEYAILMLVIMTLCFYLYHPDNLIYHAAREKYDLTVLLLSFPGP